MKSDRRNTPGNSIDGMPQSNKPTGLYVKLPRGYAGAKLARKAIMKMVAVNHPRGTRANGVTV